jgi:hypothetical protein
VCRAELQHKSREKKPFGKMANLKYVGRRLTNKNSIKEETKNRLTH